MLSCWIDMLGVPKTKPVPLGNFEDLCVPRYRFCIENRAADMCMNPYLSFAMTAAATVAGVEEAVDPGSDSVVVGCEAWFVPSHESSRSPRSTGNDRSRTPARGGIVSDGGSGRIDPVSSALPSPHDRTDSGYSGG